MNEIIGFTTSVPVEIIFAAGDIPIDLNNVFISSKRAEELVFDAEGIGFPRNTCAWIKGIYSALKDHGNIDKLITVIEGDCSNAKALMEVLSDEGIICIPFSYPYNRGYNLLDDEIKKLMKIFNVTNEDCLKVKKELDRIRIKLVELDRLSWQENKVSGFENHILQVSSSDFNGDYNKFEKDLDNTLLEISKRKQKKSDIRIGYIGVPPIIKGFYEFVERCDANIVFNEVQRQFTMLNGIGLLDITKQYINFTYPYRLEYRLNDIEKEIKIRNIDGLIHYTQSFCFRGIEDILIRDRLNIPILTIEGDRPGEIDERTKLRIEAFLDILK